MSAALTGVFPSARDEAAARTAGDAFSSADYANGAPGLVFAVPQGAEERAVRAALRRAKANVPVVTMGIGSLAAGRAARGVLAGVPPRCIVVTGLCGLLGSGIAVGEALLYSEIVSASDRLAFDSSFGHYVGERAGEILTGIRAFASESIVTLGSAKRALAERYAAQAVDMETLAFARALQPAGIAVAALRVGSDGAADDLPDLNGALDGSGGMDGFALALAMLRDPVAGVRLARNGTRALAALERAVYRLALARP